MRGSFTQNRDGLNHTGTEEVLCIDYFLKDHKIDFGYYGHQLGKFERCYHMKK